jgi:hypothetical protein
MPVFGGDPKIRVLYVRVFLSLFVRVRLPTSLLILRNLPCGCSCRLLKRLRDEEGSRFHVFCHIVILSFITSCFLSCKSNAAESGCCCCRLLKSPDELGSRAQVLRLALGCEHRQKCAGSTTDAQLSCPCACRLLKRLRDEEGSRFQGQPVLHQRYVLLALLGRGGFSEVHKAYDLASLKFVAVKVRGLVRFHHFGGCRVGTARARSLQRGAQSL